MRGRGLNSRDLSGLTGVAHQTIENWLSDSTRGTADQVEKVAGYFEWTYSELFDGTPPQGIMTRVAELEAFKSLAVAFASGILNMGSPQPVDPSKLPAMGPGTPIRPGDLRDR